MKRGRGTRGRRAPYRVGVRLGSVERLEHESVGLLHIHTRAPVGATLYHQPQIRSVACAARVPLVTGRTCAWVACHLSAALRRLLRPLLDESERLQARQQQQRAPLSGTSRRASR